MFFLPGTDVTKYPMDQGRELGGNPDFVEQLRGIAQQSGHTDAQLVLSWTIHQPTITAALCGARHPDQIRENAVAEKWQSPQQQTTVQQTLQQRGTAGTGQPPV